MTFAKYVSRVTASKWFARVLSFVVAVLLWQYVYFQNQEVEQMLLPIEFKNPSADLYTEEVNLTGKMVIGEIAGKVEDLREVYNIVRTMRCYIDLSDSKEGSHKYPIQLEKNAAIRLALQKVDFRLMEEFVEIPFQKNVEKEIPIRLNVEEKLKNRFAQIGTITYNPQKAKVRGPEGYVSQLEYIESKVFFFKDKFGDFQASLPLLHPNEHIESITPKQIQVSVQFKTDIQDVKFTDVTLMVVNNLKNLQVLNMDDLKLRYILYRGPENLVKTINVSALVAYIDLSKYNKPGRYSVFVYPQEFEHIEVLEYDPKHITVQLGERKQF